MLAPAGTDEEDIHRRDPAKALERRHELAHCRRAAPSCIIEGVPNKARGKSLAEPVARASRPPGRQGRRQPAGILGVGAAAPPSSARWRAPTAMCACAARSRASAAPHSSGHCYFALKDDKARIEAVIWRTTVQGLRVQAGRRAGGDRHRPGHDLSGHLQLPDRHRRAGAGRHRRADGAAGGAQEEARRRGPVRRGARSASCRSCRASSASSPRRPGR